MNFKLKWYTLKINYNNTGYKLFGFKPFNKDVSTSFVSDYEVYLSDTKYSEKSIIDYSYKIDTLRQ